MSESRVHRAERLLLRDAVRMGQAWLDGTDDFRVSGRDIAARGAVLLAERKRARSRQRRSTK